MKRLAWAAPWLFWVSAERKVLEIGFSLAIRRRSLQCMWGGAKKVGGVGRLWPWAAAVGSGVLATLCFPPFDQGWLVWVCLAPLLAAVWFGGDAEGLCRRTAWRGAALGLVFGMAHFASVFFWITTVSVVGWAVFMPYLALYPAGWGAVAGMLGNPCRQNLPDGRPSVLSSRRNLLLAARLGLAWVGLEWLRGWLFTGFGWNPLAVGLYRHILLLQVAEWGGAGLVSFQIVFVNVIAVVTVARLVKEVGRTRIRPHFDFNLTVVMVVCGFAYGIHAVQRTIPSEPLKVAAVQPAIPQKLKWDEGFEAHIRETYAGLTEAALAFEPDLLLWPEAATPRPLLGDRETYGFARGIVERLPEESAFLLGTLDFTVEGDFNAAVWLRRDPQATGFYYKLHLVPFGEFIPFRHSFPLFAWVAGDLVPGDFNAGTAPVVFELHGGRVRVAPLICFEDTLDRVVRRFAPIEPTLLVNLTNDGWFHDSPASAQHLANAVLRCVEMRLPMVRCANTGVTACVDSFGRVTHILSEPGAGTFARGVLMARVDVPQAPQRTLYAVVGNAFAVSALFLTILSAIPLWHAGGRAPGG